MKTLQDVWDWYESVTTNLGLIIRIGSRHWDHPSLEATPLWQDEKLKEVTQQTIVKTTAIAIDPLEDLGILVPFSVFEAAVRDYLEAIVRPLTGNLGHPILEHAAMQAIEGIQQGSFANEVLTPLKKQKHITNELSDRVKQVRDYRNWVAHGKRDPKGPSVFNLTAKGAFECLKEFLEALSIAVEAEEKRAERQSEHVARFSEGNTESIDSAGDLT